MKLKPSERAILVNSLFKSLDQPDKGLDDIWAEEAEKRLEGYRNGVLEDILMEDVFREYIYVLTQQNSYYSKDMTFVKAHFHIAFCKVHI